MSERERDPFTGQFLKAGANERFEVSVYRMADGDHIKQLWDATNEEVEDVQEQYGGDPEYDVVVKPK